MFADAEINVLNYLKIPLIKWVASKEKHQDGNVHYHMAIHLTEKKKWRSIKNIFQDRHGLIMHFVSKLYSFYTAYKYVTKCANITESDIRLSWTAGCMEANVNKGKR